MASKWQVLNVLQLVSYCHEELQFKDIITNVDMIVGTFVVI